MKLNMKFKMTPLVIFMILLVVLVISMFIGRSMREGLSSTMMSKKVNEYSTTKDLYVLHENLMFDIENGNLVETQGVDASGNKIDGDLYITPRSGSVTYYTDGSDASNNASVTMGTVSPSHASWEYPSQTTGMGNKNVYYIGWGEQTYLMVHDKDENKLVGSYLFDGKKKQVADNTETPVMLTHYRAIANASNNSLVSETLYTEDRDVYQIAENVKFDFKTGDLIVKTGSSDIKIYRRGEGLITTDADIIKQRTNVSMSEFTPMYALDELGQNLIVYLPYKQQTMVVLLGHEGSASEVLVMKSITKFTENGTEGANAKTILELKSANGEVVEDDKATEESSPDITSEDYILKTQIVPPVCPTCPSCPKEVTCTNCGGQGGSGTMGTDGKSLVKEDKKTKLETPIKNVATGIVGGAGEVAGKAVGGVGEVAGKAVGGVGEVAGKSVEVVGDVAGKTIDTADSLIRDTAGTAGGLVKDTASGIAGLFKMSPTSVKEKKEDNYRLPGLQTGLGTRTNNTALPSKNHRTAEFDYMGAVPQKKSTQFMPVTADFSAFSR
jgi:hypothetical protein